MLMLPAMVLGAITLDCEHIKVNDKSFDLTPLAGPHQIKYSEEVGQSVRESSYTIDLCRPLGKVKGLPSEEQCPSGTRGNGPICASRWLEAIQLIQIPQSAESNAQHP